MTTSSTLVFAKPEKAFAAEIVPVSTTVAAASMVDVSSGKAPSRTDTIAARKMANRCHAATVSPAGTGLNHIPIANPKGIAHLITKPQRIVASGAFARTANSGVAISMRPVFPIWLAKDLLVLCPAGLSIGPVRCRLRFPSQTARRIRRCPSHPHNGRFRQ